MKTNLLNCDSCSICCQGDAIILHSELGDKAEDYKTEMLGDKIMLAHKPNFDCYYLTETGCGIYENRPAICKEFSCAVLAKRIGYTKARKLAKKGLIKMPLFYQGLRKAKG